MESELILQLIWKPDHVRHIVGCKVVRYEQGLLEIQNLGVRRLLHLLQGRRLLHQQHCLRQVFRRQHRPRQ